MRFYTNNHQHYCGIDLHAKTMYLCILGTDGEVLLHPNPDGQKLQRRLAGKHGKSKAMSILAAKLGRPST